MKKHCYFLVFRSYWKNFTIPRDQSQTRDDRSREERVCFRTRQRFTANATLEIFSVFLWTKRANKKSTKIPLYTVQRSRLIVCNARTRDKRFRFYLAKVVDYDLNRFAQPFYQIYLPTFFFFSILIVAIILILFVHSFSMDKLFEQSFAIEIKRNSI